MTIILGKRVKPGHRPDGGRVGQGGSGRAPGLRFAMAVHTVALATAGVFSIATGAQAQTWGSVASEDACFGAAPTVYCQGGGSPCYGTHGNDVIRGTNGDDVIYARGGNDLVCARRGNDSVYGQNGDDQISGGSGADTLRGGRGHDVLHGNGHEDTLIGGAGRDRLYGGEHADTIEGNDGDDIIDGGLGSDTIDAGGGDDTVDGNRGHDTIYGGDGRDTLFGGNGRDTLYGENGMDTLGGGPDDDDLYGGPQSDQLDGGSGNDELFGGDGDDLLFGNTGSADSCNGGAGIDTDSDETCEEVELVEIPEQESPPGEGAICEIWGNDCGAGYKCIPDGLEGIPRCRAIVDNPDQVGDACMTLADDGVDSCDVDGMCIQGECVALCGGEPANPNCSHSPLSAPQCHFYPDGPALCEESCDPLQNRCSDGRVCAAEPGSIDFTCAVAPEGLPALAGDACTSMAQCQAGHACMQANELEFGFCDQGAVNCCASMCDLDEPGVCPGDHQCVPYFGNPPPGLEHVGVCAIPF